MMITLIKKDTLENLRNFKKKKLEDQFSIKRNVVYARLVLTKQAPIIPITKTKSDIVMRSNMKLREMRLKKNR